MSSRSASVLLGLTLLAGCAAPAAEDGDLASSEEALTPGSLRDRTALDRLRVLGPSESSIAVEYAPPADGAYPGASRDVAFEPVRIEAPGEASEITVAGDFPSTATVLVTDESFRVVAAAATSPSAEGLEEARVRVSGGVAGRLVLVRDPKWVRPMVFEVRVDR